MWKVLLGIGVIVAIIGGIVLAMGYAQKAKAGNLSSAPQVKTADAASKGASIGNKDGLVTIAGNVKCAEPLISPVAGTPCLFYYYQLKRSWEESSVDSSTGKVKKTSKSEVVDSKKEGADFTVDDGSGPIHVVLKDSGGLDLVSSPSKIETDDDGGGVTKSLFGKTKRVSDSTYTSSEDILKPADKFTVHGKLQDGKIGPDGIMISVKSRDELLKDTASTAGKMLIIGWGSTVVGLLLIVGSVMVRPKNRAS